MSIFARVLLAAGVLLASLVAGGCQKTSRITIPVEGIAVRPDLSTDVEVVNWNGDVRVVADPRYKQPEVRAQVRRLSKDAPKSSELRETVKVSAVAGIDSGRRLVRVKGEPAGAITKDLVALDLIVRVARAEDVRVSTSGGDVFVSGFAGSLNVVNGPGGSPGGDIQAWTQRGIKSPVTMTTSKGNIIYKSGPGTTGTFDLAGGGDSASLEARLGRITQAKPDPLNYRYRAILDGGTNPMTFRSEKGTVRVEILENAGTSGPDVWDGWPNPASGPRWIQALTGTLPDPPVAPARPDAR